MVKPFAAEAFGNRARGEVEAEGYRRCGAKVEVFEAGNGEAEVCESVVRGLEAREDGMVVVNPTLCVVVNIEQCRSGTADGNAVVQSKELHGGISL